MRRRRATLRPVGEEIARDARDVATRADKAAMELFSRQAALGDVLAGARLIEMTTRGRLVIGPIFVMGAPNGACFGYMSRRWAEARLAELREEEK